MSARIFVGLCLLSLSLLILGVTIGGLMMKVLLHLWHNYRARQKLQEDLRVAEILAEHDFKVQKAEEFAIAFPGLSYQTTPAAPVNYGYGIRPAITLPLRIDEEMIKSPVPLPSRPASAVRHRLRIVPFHDEPGARRDETEGDLLEEVEEQEEQEEDVDEHPTPQVFEDDSSMHLTVGLGTDPGIARKNAPNEDSLFAIQGIRITDEGSKPAGLFVIADGMGGHVNGREASRSAIHALTDVIVPTLLRDVSGSSAREEETMFVDMLKDGVHRANLSLYRRNRDIQGMMGTTLTAAQVIDTNAYIANVGDSRTYLYRADEGLRQITRDHSIVAQMVENGVITREDIYTHPRRNQIYRCLGEHATVEIDTFVVPLLADDVLILCSDGLWEMVRDQDLEKIVARSAHHPDQLSTLLMQAALNNGGADNISVIVVRVAC